MIGFLRGQFAAKTPARVIIDVNGVGYEVNISLHTYSAIVNLEGGQLYTYLHITENAQSLFGFADIAEKELFLHLISVSGVGASTARMMLSGMHPDEIVKAIVQGNTKQLESIKGIGKKSAERLIVELRDKLAKVTDSTILPGFTGGGLNTDAINALISLGIGKAMAEQSVKKAIAVLPLSASVEEIIKHALKNL
ncbi:MAG: Holliday junction branch migration protein RuvA [Sediminibacterium sp.]|jgi:holliday junction DNA helicase RuvA|nr:Holliday junction branch migration protein RuvA [Chitinophagaceae bacterium]MCA6448457.1 Holliday junction branch migration protein RuvA [Chitinophagaceae bacterium]